MTVSTESRRAGPFSGDDLTVNFAFTFPVFVKSDIAVIHADTAGAETALTLDSDYTVTLNDDQDASPGGIATLSSALATGCRLVILGDTSFTQEVKMMNQGAWYPSVINAALDRLTMLAQQLRDEVSRIPAPPATATPDEVNDHPTWGEVVIAAESAVSASAAAASSQTLAAASAALAYAAEVAARAAAEASGSVVFFDSYAEADAALSILPNDSIVDVMADEGYGGLRVRYRVEAATLVLKTILGDAAAGNVLSFGAKGDGIADDTVAVQLALDSCPTVFIPLGLTVICSNLVGDSVRILGPGTIKKKSNTNGKLLTLTGTCHMGGGLIVDYDQSNALATDPQYGNVSVYLESKGRLFVHDSWFKNSFYAAIVVSGGSLHIGKGTLFTDGRPHNGLSGAGARPTYYVACFADADTSDETIVLEPGVIMIGSQQDALTLHKNPAGYYSTDYRSVHTSLARFKSISITGAIMLYTGHNCGGNVAGPVDTYNGAENIIVADNIFRHWAAGLILQNSSNFVLKGNIIVGGSAPAGSDAVVSQGIITQEKVRLDGAEQQNGVISGNYINGAHYIGIDNACDNVVITGNIVDGVTETGGIGTGIYNAGSNVAIIGNIGRNISGQLLSSTGDRCTIHSNIMRHDSNASTSGAVLSGDTVSFRNNVLWSNGDDGYSGIYVGGHLSNADIDGNVVRGYHTGLDVRVTDGAVSNLHVGINRYLSLGGDDESISTSCTGVTRTMTSLQPVSVTINPASLAAGASDSEQTTTVSGAVVGDIVLAGVSSDTFGLTVAARVSAPDTVKWYFHNPSGNPNGTQDLGSVTVSLKVIK